MFFEAALLVTFVLRDLSTEVQSNLEADRNGGSLVDVDASKRPAPAFMTSPMLLCQQVGQSSAIDAPAVRAERCPMRRRWR